MVLHNAAVTGSLTVNGVEVSSITGSSTYSASFASQIASLNAATASLNTYTSSNNTNISALNAQSASFLAYTASNDAKITSLNTFSSSILSYTSSNDAQISSIYITTSSLNSYTSSANTKFAGLDAASGSAITRLGALEVASGSAINRLSSLETASGSAITRLNSIENKTGSYATTGSNTFVGGQYFSSSFSPTGFTTTASLYTDGGLRVTKDAYISGTLYLNNVTVFGTQSIAYISSSQLNIGTNIITVNTDTPSVRFGGLAVYDSGSTGLTGSILWDSQANHWIYSNPSGSSYSGGMFISGPRTSTLGSETGTTSCMLLAGQGGDHLTSSMIYHSSTATCIPNTLIGSTVCGSTSTFSSTSTACNFVTSGNTLFGITLKGRSSDNYGAIGFYSSDGGTRYGYLQSHSTNCGQLIVNGDGGGQAIFDCRGVVLTSALTGTTACFGNTGTGNNVISILNNDQSNTRLRITNTGSGGRTYSIVGGLNGANNSSLSIYDETASSTRLEINSTGAATFACSVTATKMILSNGDNLSWGGLYGAGIPTISGYNDGAGSLYFYPNGSTSSATMRITSTGIACFSSNVCVGNSLIVGSTSTFGSDMFTYLNGGIFFSGGGSYNAGIFGRNGGCDLILQSGGLQRLIITSTGISCFSCQVCAPSVLFNTVGTSTLVNTNITATTCFGATSRSGFTGLTDNCNGVYFGMGADGTGISAGIGFFRESSGWNSALAFYTNCITDGVTVPRIQEKMRITSCGNVGIGNNSPSTILHTTIQTCWAVNGTIANSYPVATFSQCDCAGGARGLQIGVPTGGVNSPVFLKVNNTGARFAILDQSNCENFTISGVRIGLGTTVPCARIETTGGGYILRGGWGLFCTAYTDDGLFSGCATPNLLSTNAYGGASPKFGSDSGLLLGYQDNGAGLYSPAYGFEVKSTDGRPVTGNVVKAIVMRDTDTGAYPFWINNNGSAYFANCIGIGTSSPAGLLQLQSTTPTLYITGVSDNNAIREQAIYFGASNTSTAGYIKYQSYSQDNYMSIATNGSERMRITSGGTLKMIPTTISNNNAVFAAGELGGYKYFQGTLASGEKFGSQGGTYVLGFYFITWFDGSSSRGYAMYATTNPTANAGTVLISSGGTYTASATYNASSAVSLAFDGSSRGAVLSNNTGVSLTFYAYVFGGV
jgi:hypothetical protein